MTDNSDVLAVTANTAGKAAFKNKAKNRQQYARPMTDKVSWRSQIPLSKCGKTAHLHKKSGFPKYWKPALLLVWR